MIIETPTDPLSAASMAVTNKSWASSIVIVALRRFNSPIRPGKVISASFKKVAFLLSDAEDQRAERRASGLRGIAGGGWATRKRVWIAR